MRDMLEQKKTETLKAELKNATIPAICTAWLDLMPCATPRLNACVPAHKELQDDDNP